MGKNNQTLQQTLQLIADILSFETSDALLESQLMAQTIDWDSIVTAASKHLMLPALYCRLDQKTFLKYLPEDLVLYLKELTDLNRSRNRQLLKETLEISQLFEKHHIRYTFIKGIALLSGNYYKDIGERMVGDIDILVDSANLDTAFNLLVAHGYSRFVDFNYEVKNYRHLARQISDNHLGAVELHDQLLKHGYNYLIDKENFLENAQIVDGIRIPNATDLIRNAIFAHQINDDGYFLNTLRLKGIYDILSLKANKNEKLLRELFNQKYSSTFLRLSGLFFPELHVADINNSDIYHKKLFLLKMKYPKLRQTIYKIKFLYLNVMERLKLFCFNRSYRKHILKHKMLK